MIMNDKLPKPAGRYPAIAPRPRTRPGTPAPPAAAPVPTTPPEPAAPQPKTIIVEVRGKKKRRATGDHKGGWCRPPEENQFKKGCKPGPGRQKGSKSQDSLMRAEFLAKQSVREGGVSKKYAKRVLIAKMTINGPIEKRNSKELFALNAEARRLFPEEAADAGEREAYDAEADRQAVQQLLGHLQFGEPNPDGGDPLADMATGGPDLGPDSEGGAWSEGDWDADDDADDGEMSDDDR
jgi:hypothetical protein